LVLHKEFSVAANSDVKCIFCVLFPIPIEGVVIFGVMNWGGERICVEEHGRAKKESEQSERSRTKDGIMTVTNSLFGWVYFI
jgi:hypothetical protein